MKESERAAYAQGIAAGMADGGVYVPAGLLRHYRKAGLNADEAMVLLQLMLFRQAEYNEFPTLEQLGERIGMDPQETARLVQRLMKEGFLAIEESFDPLSGVQSEAYNWRGWLARTAAVMSGQEKRNDVVRRETEGRSGADALTGGGRDNGGIGLGLSAERKPPAQQNIFSVFEQEFGRPLSPMELETISGWLDHDRYPEELILFALKESVFAGKLHFRYIDRILLEWSRNRVTNADEARAHAQNFRGGGKG